MTIHNRKIGASVILDTSDDQAVESFVAQLTHIPDPEMRRYCHAQILAASTVEEMAAAVLLVQDLCDCFAPALCSEAAAPSVVPA